MAHMNIGMNSIGDKGLLEFLQFQNLKYLSVWHNSINAEGLMEFLTSSYKRELDLNVIGNNFQAEDVRELKKFLKDRREPMLEEELEFIMRELK